MAPAAVGAAWNWITFAGNGLVKRAGDAARRARLR